MICKVHANNPFTKSAAKALAQAFNSTAGYKSNSFVGNTISILAFQLSINAINKIMTERNGMGDTGESYLVGQDQLMRLA